MNTSSQLFSVDEAVLRIRRRLQLDEVLVGFYVSGHITEIKERCGHLYFSLRGDGASLSCVMFRSDAVRLPVLPREGENVAARARADVYPERGTLQLYVSRMLPLGESAAARARRALEARLASEGLFSLQRKRPMPRWPMTVACVTSPSGAAVRDAESVRRRRFPAANMVVVPCVVQGVTAAESATLALRRAALIPGLDAVLLLRGGGSREDLNPFDDELLVREIARSSVPVITGIGHATDKSLCDMAADAWAVTPTAAAELLFPDAPGILRDLETAQKRLERSARRMCETLALRLDRLAEAIRRSARQSLRLANARLQTAEARLRLISALAASLTSGIHCSVYTQEGQSEPLTSVSQVGEGAEVNVCFSDGILHCRVLDVQLKTTK